MVAERSDEQLVVKIEHGDGLLLRVGFFARRALASAAPRGRRLDVADARADDVHLPPGLDLLRGAPPHAFDPLGFRRRHHGRGDRLTPLRKFGEHRRVEVAERRHRHRPRDRRRRHHQEVGHEMVATTAPQHISLFDAEAVLFVDDDHAEIEELDLLLEQRVGSHDDARLAGHHVEQRLTFALGLHRAGQQHHTRRAVGGAEFTGSPQIAEHRRDGPKMLRGENFRRREDRALMAVVDDAQHGEQRHEGLAGTDLTLQQPAHRRRVAQVVCDLGDHQLLPIGESERKSLQEAVFQAAGNVRARGCGFGTAREATLREDCLDRERLVEFQSIVRGGDVCIGVGDMNGADRLVKRHQTSAFAFVVGQRVDERLDVVENLTNRRPDVPCLDLAVRGIQRHDRSIERGGDVGRLRSRAPLFAGDLGLGRVHLGEHRRPDDTIDLDVAVRQNHPFGV